MCHVLKLWIVFNGMLRIFFYYFGKEDEDGGGEEFIGTGGQQLNL